VVITWNQMPRTKIEYIGCRHAVALTELGRFPAELADTVHVLVGHTIILRQSSGAQSSRVRD
jgi:hypothetical protein